jgi:ketosteroid isomerase-like protein
VAAVTAEDVARAYFDAHARRDPDGLAELYSPEVVIDITSQGVLRGPKEARDYFAALYAAVPDAEMITDRIVPGDGVAAVQWRLRGNFTGSPLPAGIDATGGWVELRGCDVVESDGGKVTRITAYIDGMELARSLGMLPPADSAAEKGMVAAFNLATKVRQTVRDRFAQ